MAANQSESSRGRTVAEQELVLREQGNEQEVIVDHSDEIEVRLFRLTQDLNDAGEIVGRSWEQVRSCRLPVEERVVSEYVQFTHEHEGYSSSYE